MKKALWGANCERRKLCFFLFPASSLLTAPAFWFTAIIRTIIEKYLYSLHFLFQSVSIAIGRRTAQVNMELDLQSLFGHHMSSCTHWLRSCNPPPPPPPTIWAHVRGRYWSAKIDDISLWLPGVQTYTRPATRYANPTCCIKSITLYTALTQYEFASVYFRLDCNLESISTRFSRLLAEYSSFQVIQLHQFHPGHSY